MSNFFLFFRGISIKSVISRLPLDILYSGAVWGIGTSNGSNMASIGVPLEICSRRYSNTAFLFDTGAFYGWA